MSRHINYQRALVVIVVTLIACTTIFPLWWLLVSSFTPELLIFKQFGLWPTHFTLENYATGWRGVSNISFSTFFANTFFMVGLQVLGTLFSSSLAAFAFARLDFTLKRFFFAVMLLLMMLPHHVTLIPRYIIFHRLGWLDSYLPLVVPTFFAINGFFIFLMVQFIRGLPGELDEAATVDGCTPIGIYWYIILPLMKPALVTAAIFTFIWNWNDFFSHLIYINNPRIYTVALALRAYMDSSAGTQFGPMFAMSILSLIPIFLIFVSAQRLLIQGIATTGLKG